MSREWMDDAACLGVNVTVFFPEDEDYTDARMFCGKCRHRPACLRWALNFETPDVTRYGMFGGMTPEERDRYMNP